MRHCKQDGNQEKGKGHSQTILRHLSHIRVMLSCLGALTTEWT